MLPGFFSTCPARTAEYAPPPFPLVDLHAHFFFHEGTGVSLWGSFDSPLKAKDWKSRLSSRVNARALDQSDVGLAVAALYSHPLFPISRRESIRRQIREAREFVRSHSGWVLARNAEEGRKAHQAGKRVLLLSIEGMSGVLENDHDIEEFIGEGGVTIVTPLHFTDDEFGGAAFMPPPWLMWLDNPIAALSGLFTPRRDADGTRLNPHGLTARGKAMIGKLAARGVWIDLSHSSDASQADILAILARTGQPVLYTHTILRADFRGERGISPSQLERVAESRGIVGVLPSDDMLHGTQVDPRFCPAACHGSCQGGVPAFLTQFSQIQKAVAPQGAVMIGSDIDAPMAFLQPSCPGVGDRRGLWNYAQLPLIWDALRDAGLLDSQTLREGMVPRFLDSWSQVKTAGERRSSLIPELPPRISVPAQRPRKAPPPGSRSGAGNAPAPPPGHA